MNLCEEAIKEEIRQTGPITFARFMELALYHPFYGYYVNGSVKQGKTGDYITSPTVSNIFGRILAKVLLAMWDLMRASRFTIIEMGSGNGVLAGDIMESLETAGRLRGLRYFMVERSYTLGAAAQKKLSRFPGVKWVRDISEIDDIAGIEGCILSNEFIDALPFHTVEMGSGELHEIYVVEKNGGFAEQPGPPTPEISAYFEGNRDSPHFPKENGDCPYFHRTEVRLESLRWLRQVAEVLSRGFVLTIDYGFPVHEYLAPHRSGGTMVTYGSHTISRNPYLNVGRQDITAHVDFTSLAQEGIKYDIKPVGFTDQGTFFLHWGKEILREKVESQDLKGRLSVQELFHPDTLGGSHMVFMQAKEIAGANLWEGIPNRVNRLITPGRHSERSEESQSSQELEITTPPSEARNDGPTYVKG